MVSTQKILFEIMRYYCWTQQDLANYFKLEKSQVSRWLSGKTVPRCETYNKLKEKYDEIIAKDVA